MAKTDDDFHFEYLHLFYLGDFYSAWQRRAAVRQTISHLSFAPHWF
jgi:hypothetical protein